VTPVICLVTDRHTSGGVEGVVAHVARAARAGVQLIHIRERDLEARTLTALVARCLEAVRGTRTRVVVNDRLDVALAAGAHGVHLRAESMPGVRVRAVTPPGFLIGRSVHAREEAARVEAAGGLDYLVFGTVFASASKPGRAPAGPPALAEVVQAVRVPVLAIGGVTPDNLHEVAATGAAGFAAITLFTAPSDRTVAQVMARAAEAWAALRKD